MSRERAVSIQPLFTLMMHPLGRTWACTHATGSRPTHSDEEFFTTAVGSPWSDFWGQSVTYDTRAPVAQ